MKNKKAKNKRSYFFIGIGGVSMSALAYFVKNSGFGVAGSDQNPNIKLNSIKVFKGHASEHIKDYDVIVYTAAIDNKNPEILEAKRLNKKIISRAELLAEIAAQYKNVISVSGMHGKTTTTALIAEIFLQAGLQPSVHIGGVSNALASNFYIGKKNYFITEACEYKDSFLTLNNTVGVVLNIEPEHLDYFGSSANIARSFQKFAANSKKVVINNKHLCETSDLDCANFKPIKLTKKATSEWITFGEAGVYCAKNIYVLASGLINFDCFEHGKLLANIKLNAIGLHNVENALAAIAVARNFKIKPIYICKALEEFHGVKRRMEIVNKSPLIIHDYAHHPTEIASTVNAVLQNFCTLNVLPSENCNCENTVKPKMNLESVKFKKKFIEIKNQNFEPSIYKACLKDDNFSSIICDKQNLSDNQKLKKALQRKLIVVFQPHTYSRTAMFKQEFIESLRACDVLFLFKTFAAREPEDAGISAKQLWNQLGLIKQDCFYYEDVNLLKNHILKISEPNSIILVLGAGDLYENLNFNC